MKKNKQELKEMQMAMAIKALSYSPLRHYPSEEEFAEIGKLLVMAYENYPRFVSFGLVCWRDYNRTKNYKEMKQLVEAKKAWEFFEKDRQIFEAMRNNPEIKREMERLFEEWRQELKVKKVKK